MLQGHPDVAMAPAQAVPCVRTCANVDRPNYATNRNNIDHNAGIPTPVGAVVGIPLWG